MSLKNKGVMVILSSPSGAGKTTLVKLLSEENKYKISISHTTRKPRLNEKNGIDYFFVEKKKFKEMINNDEFLEYAEVFNNYYGTTNKNVFLNLDKGINMVFDIDWQGTEKIVSKQLNYKLISFFILPPSRDELLKRLSNRDMKDKLIVEERMKQFDKDILHWRDYDYVVINDNLNNCYKKIISFIDSEINNKENQYDKGEIEKLVKSLI
jgi:guanylate kinase